MGHRRNLEGKATVTDARSRGGLSREWLSCDAEIVAAVRGPTGAPTAVESRRRREVKVSTSLWKGRDSSGEGGHDIRLNLLHVLTKTIE